MIQKFHISGFIILSLLVYNCAPPNENEQDHFDTSPAFNPNPTPKYLSPEESIKTIYLPKGYHVELVCQRTHDQRTGSYCMGW
jgi:hypothetical protein